MVPTTGEFTPQLRPAGDSPAGRRDTSNWASEYELGPKLDFAREAGGIGRSKPAASQGRVVARELGGVEKVEELHPELYRRPFLVRWKGDAFEVLENRKIKVADPIAPHDVATAVTELARSNGSEGSRIEPILRGVDA